MKRSAHWGEAPWNKTLSGQVGPNAVLPLALLVEKSQQWDFPPSRPTPPLADRVMCFVCMGRFGLVRRPVPNIVLCSALRELESIEAVELT